MFIIIFIGHLIYTILASNRISKEKQVGKTVKEPQGTFLGWISTHIFFGFQMDIIRKFLGDPIFNSDEKWTIEIL